MSGEHMDAAHVMALRGVLLASLQDRPDALADAVVEYGPEFVDSLQRIVGEPAAAGFEASDQRLLAELAARAESVLSAWLTGERVTRRVDEQERRIRVIRRWAQADATDAVLTRLAIDAILRLPPGHPDRDLAFARAAMLHQVERGRRSAEHLDDMLVATFYLLHHDLLSAEDSARLIDETLTASATGKPDPAAVRDLLHAGHNYCMVRAGEQLATGGADYPLWMKRGQRLLDMAGGEAVGLGSRLTAMTARQLDLAGDEHRAADSYAAQVDAGDARTRTVQFQALSEATLRLQAGEHQRLVDRLAPLLPILTDRYVTAVIESDIEDAGFAHARAVTLIVSGYTHLGRLDDAITVIDLAKSLRLRYRVALTGHPARAEVIALERHILALDRAGSLPVEAQFGAEIDLGGGGLEPVADDDAEMSPRTRLLERFRRLRPDLADQLRPRPLDQIAAALASDEVAIVLAGLDDMTLVGAVTGSGRVAAVALTEWPWQQWQQLMAGHGGWLAALTREPGTDGPAALARLVERADLALGRTILDLVRQVGDDVRQVAIIPHRWLHLVPYWALPSLADLSVRMFSSADELVVSRSRPRETENGGCLVVADPTGDLPCSASEAASIARWVPLACRVVGAQEQQPATIAGIYQALETVTWFHFSGHAFSDHRDPNRSALLLAVTTNSITESAADSGASMVADPFQPWLVAAGPWSAADGGWKTAKVQGVGRLWERDIPGARTMERRMERGTAPTLSGLYVAGRLRRLGELWSAADMLVSGRALRCRFAFLSACESGLAGGASTYLDEYGGLPAALRLGGVDGLICSLWPVDEGFAAVFVERFYTTLAAGAGDPLAVVREVRRWLMEVSKWEVLNLLDELADRVRSGIPRAAFALEAYRDRINQERGDRPYADAWDWAAFYPLGGGGIRPAPADIGGDRQ